jgi:hypothetical protein
MRTLHLPATLGTTVACIGWTVTGGAGTLAALALAHKTGAAAVVTGAATMVIAAHVGESASKTLPAIIAAISDLMAARILAKADARATIVNATTRAELASAGLDPDKAPQAIAMMRAASTNPDLREGRRLADEAIVRLQGSPHARTNTSEPSTGPSTPGNGSRTAKATRNKVISIHSDSSLSPDS